MPNPNGRPTTYTPEIGARIANRIRTSGLPLKFAAPLEGVPRATAFWWQAQGREGREPYVDFVEQLEVAQSEAVETLLGEIRTAQGGKDAAPWTNKAWILERTHVQDFGRTVQQVEHTGTVEIVRVELPAGASLRDLRALAGKVVEGEVVPNLLPAPPDLDQEYQSTPTSEPRHR